MTDGLPRIYVNPITTNRGSFIEGEWYDIRGSKLITTIEYSPTEPVKSMIAAAVAEEREACAALAEAAAKTCDSVGLTYEAVGLRTAAIEIRRRGEP
ncbi:MAG: hypothetical protein ACRC52_07450 [Aeromonas veronii]